jgi:hypothetical protein
MDDNNVPTLHDSQHEWAIRLTRIVQPLIYEGIQGMFQESVTICKQSEEDEKYLMTFQNILSRIPKWNEEIIGKETARIVERSGCSYLEDLLTCVHIAQLKILSSIRTGKAQKKVEIDIPKLSSFVHKVYIAVSRDLYASVYLFEKGIPPLVFQKNRSQVNEIILNAILNVIRESIPIEKLLRAYLDETTDLIKEKEKEKEDKKGISFSDKDNAVTVNNEPMVIDAPKDIPTLEKIAEVRNLERKAAEEEDNDKLKITDDVVTIEIDDLVKPAAITPVEIELPIELDIEVLK